jgi:hypothetical protein
MTAGARVCAVVGLFAAACAALGCPGRSRERTPPPAADETLVDLGREVGLKFPADARLFGVGRERGIDDLLRFKVEIGAADLPAFMAASPVAQDAFEPGERGFLGPDQGFWDPNRAKHLRTGQAIVKNHRALNIGIADGGPQRVILYIVNHGT